MESVLFSICAVGELLFFFFNLEKRLFLLFCLDRENGIFSLFPHETIFHLNMGKLGILFIFSCHSSSRLAPVSSDKKKTKFYSYNSV